MELPTFRKIGLPGVKTLIRWAEEEGWNPGPYDADVFYETDPDGFFGCFLNNEMIGGGSIVSYDGAFGFMGLFIVSPAYRGKGIGRSLWVKRRDLLLSRLQPGAAIGMDGVVAMQPFYASGGFEIAFRDARYERIGSSFSQDPHVSVIRSGDLADVLAYDFHCFGFDRSKFMQAWLNIPGVNAYKYHENGKLIGMAVMRKVKQGYKIGPLFADDQHIADALYRSCLNTAVGQPVYLDIPVSNPLAVDMVQTYQAKYVFECARMYHGKAPSIPITQIYGITTFELG